MTITRRTEIARKAAARGKYAPLHRRLVSLTGDIWRASFTEIEQVLGFGLPDSARLYPAWWSNGGGHSHALAWEAAGFQVRVFLREEAALFTRRDEEPGTVGEGRATSSGTSRVDLDKEWPMLAVNPFPPGFTASREELYDDDGR